MRLPKYRFGPFELDAASRELSRDGERVALPPKSFECLAYLITHRGRAVGRDELIAAVWGRGEVSGAVVGQTLLRARKALDDTGNRQSTIRTVSRFGYQWVAPVQEVLATGDAVADAGVRDMAAEPLPDAVLAAPPRDGTAKSRRTRWSWLIGLVLLA